MKLIKISIVLIIIAVSNINMQATGEEIEPNCGKLNGGHTFADPIHSFSEFYATSTEALAARQIRVDNGEGYQEGYHSLMQIETVVDTSLWNAVCCVAFGGGYWWQFAYAYPSAAQCPEGYPLYGEYETDSDGDGLPDSCDPKPNNEDPAIMRMISCQGDSGNETWINMQLKDGTFITYGDYDAGEMEYINIGAPWVDQSWLVDNGWCTEDGGQESEEGADPIGNLPIEIPDTENPNELPDGVGNDGNTTETDYLADIVTNTQNLQNSQGTISDQLHTLHQDNINEQLEEEKQEAEDMEDAEEGISNINDSDTDVEGEYTQEDVPEKNLIEDILDGFVNNNPVQTVINDTGIDTTGAFCSFDWDYKGNTVTFSICEYENQLEIMGGILIAITALCSLVIILRRS